MDEDVYVKLAELESQIREIERDRAILKGSLKTRIAPVNARYPIDDEMSFTQPNDLKEAETRIAALLWEIDDIERQLGDALYERDDYSVWQRKAKYAQVLARRRFLQLIEWRKRYINSQIDTLSASHIRLSLERNRLKASLKGESRNKAELYPVAGIEDAECALITLAGMFQKYKDLYGFTMHQEDLDTFIAIWHIAMDLNERKASESSG